MVIKIKVIITKRTYIEELNIIKVLTNTNSKCPAVILATSRIVRVKGRIKFLTISINTIRGINRAGVP